jgi:hypothetical protein
MGCRHLVYGVEMTSIDWLLSVLIPALAANTAVLYGLWYWVRIRLINVSFERAINAAQSAMLVCMDEGPTFGVIVAITPNCAADFGFAEKELIGKPVDWLIPDTVGAAEHKKHMQEFARNPKRRVMSSASANVSGRMQNGMIIPVVVSLAPCSIDQKQYCVASILTMARLTSVKAQIEGMINKIVTEKGDT